MEELVIFHSLHNPLNIWHSNRTDHPSQTYELVFCSECLMEVYTVSAFYDPLYTSLPRNILKKYTLRTTVTEGRQFIADKLLKFVLK